MNLHMKNCQDFCPRPYSALSNESTTLLHTRPTMSKIPVNSTSSYSSDSLQNQIVAALIANGSIQTIQASLLYELQASGWTTALQNFITTKVRNGECTKFDDLITLVMDESMKTVNVEKGRSNMSDAKNGLKIPENAIKESIKVVKKELEKVCEMESK